MHYTCLSDRNSLCIVFNIVLQKLKMGLYLVQNIWFVFATSTAGDVNKYYNCLSIWRVFLWLKVYDIIDALEIYDWRNGAFSDNYIKINLFSQIYICWSILTYYHERSYRKTYQVKYSWKLRMHYILFFYSRKSFHCSLNFNNYSND